MNDDPLLVGIGEVLWDCFPQGRHLGGAPGNLLLHAASFGAEAHLVSAVGDDDLGREALALLTRGEVACKEVAIRADRATGQAFISLDSEGQANFRFGDQIPWDDLQWSESLGQLAGQADLVVFGSLAQRSARSHETTLRFLEACRPDSVRLFDANLRPPHYRRETILASLGRANALKVNEQELPIVADFLKLPPASDEALVRRIADDYELDLIALTLGSRGSVVFHKGELVGTEGESVEVVDTVGAGDAFTACLLTGLYKGEELASVCSRANRLAAFVCGQSGAVPALPAHFLR